MVTFVSSARSYIKLLFYFLALQQTSSEEGITASTASRVSTDDDSFVVRLKFLTDSERLVRARGPDTIATFKQ